MNCPRITILSLIFVCVSSFALGQAKRIEIPTKENSILPKYDLSGFYRLVRQGKVKDATALIDRLQIAFPEEQEIERNFVMLLICQGRDAEVVSRAAEYVHMSPVKEWLEVPKTKLRLEARGTSARYSSKPNQMNIRETEQLQRAYSQILDGSGVNEWIKLGFLNRVLKDDPNNPEGICNLFGTLPKAEAVAKMKAFSLDRLQAAYARGNPYSTKRVLRELIEIKKWMTKNPSGIPYRWQGN